MVGKSLCRSDSPYFRGYKHFVNGISEDIRVFLPVLFRISLEAVLAKNVLCCHISICELLFQNKMTATVHIDREREDVLYS